MKKEDFEILDAYQTMVDDYKLNKDLTTEEYDEIKWKLEERFGKKRTRNFWDMDDKN